MEPYINPTTIRSKHAKRNAIVKRYIYVLKTNTEALIIMQNHIQEKKETWPLF